MTMRHTLLSTVAAMSFGFAIPCVLPESMVGGAPMMADKNIVQNAADSKDHTTLVAAVKAAGLVDTLSGPGPFTVFATTDAAFGGTRRSVRCRPPARRGSRLW